MPGMTTEEKIAMFQELTVFLQAVTAGDRRRADETLVRMRTIVAAPASGTDPA